MENNIFVKMNKYNPDVVEKVSTKQNERETLKFELNTSIYNPITNIIPNKITNTNDLYLEKDNSINKFEFQELIKQKENERLLQNEKYKPLKTKIVESVSIENKTNNNYIETFEELKSSVSSVKTNSSKYDNILFNLKELGILK